MGVVSRVRIAQVLVDRPSELDRPHLSPYVKIGIGLPSITASAPTGGRRLRRFMEAVMANTSEYRYTVSLTWTGNLGSGTSGYRDYSRDYEISAEGKPVIHGSATRPFEETAPAGTRKSCSWHRCQLVTSCGISTLLPKLGSS